MNPIVYTEKINDSFIRGLRLPYFYLHGKAGELDDYDICSANIDTFYYVLSEGLWLVDIIDTKETTYRGLIYSIHNMFRMEGLVMLVNDTDAIIQALTEYYKVGNDFPSMEWAQKEELKNQYHKTYLAIEGCTMF